jgi:hypothetical protein
MKKWLVSAAIGVALLGACSSSSNPAQSGGGFETSDLSALVVDSNGTAVSSARVWLLSDLGDSTASLALDSMASDTNGLARFKPPSNPVLGFEVWSQDSSMAVVVRGLRPPLTSPVRLVLQPTRVLTLPCYMYWAYSFAVAGSHFVQKPPACTGRDSIEVVVPAGSGDVLAMNASGGAPPMVLPFQADSLPYFRPPPPPPPSPSPPSGAGSSGP